MLQNLLLSYNASNMQLKTCPFCISAAAHNATACSVFMMFFLRNKRELQTESNPVQTANDSGVSKKKIFQLSSLCFGFYPNYSSSLACEHVFQCLFNICDGLSCCVGLGFNTLSRIYCQQRRINVSAGANRQKCNVSYSSCTQMGNTGYS